MKMTTRRNPASPGVRRFKQGQFVEDLRTGQVANVAKANKKGDAHIEVTYVDADTGKRVWESWPIEFVSANIEKAT